MRFLLSLFHRTNCVECVLTMCWLRVDCVMTVCWQWAQYQRAATQTLAQLKRCMVAVIGGGGARPSKKLRPPIHNMPPLPGNHACFQQHQLSQPMGGDATSAKPLYLFLSLSLSLSLSYEKSRQPRDGVATVSGDRTCKLHSRGKKLCHFF